MSMLVFENPVFGGGILFGLDIGRDGLMHESVLE